VRKSRVRKKPKRNLRWQRWLSRAAWLGVVPAAAALLALRSLPLPLSFDGPLASVALFAADNSVAVAVSIFLTVTGLAVYWRQSLPGGRHLEPSGKGGFGYKGLLFVAIAALAAVVVRTRVIAGVRVLSSSMQPTLAAGDTLTVNRMAYRGGRAPERGDIVVFTKDGAPEGELVKRVIGVPGDRIRTFGGVVEINGWEVPHCDVGVYAFVSPDVQMSARLYVEFLGDRAYLTLKGPFQQAVPDGYEVEKGEVFVLGDNRTNSNDSRAWAAPGVAMNRIEGRAERLISVAERTGRERFRHWLEPIGTELHVDDADTTALQQGIERCLEQRPAQTTPPASKLQYHATR
jgi:signal peptidase I